MAEDYQGYQSLSHSKWDCKYHVVFIPKKRRKVLFGQARHYLGEIFHALARQKECQILEGHLMSDHVHMCIAIPPKHAMASVISFLTGEECDYRSKATLGGVSNLEWDKTLQRIHPAPVSFPLRSRLMASNYSGYPRMFYYSPPRKSITGQGFGHKRT